MLRRSDELDIRKTKKPKPEPKKSAHIAAKLALKEREKAIVKSSRSKILLIGKQKDSLETVDMNDENRPVNIEHQQERKTRGPQVIVYERKTVGNKSVNIPTTIRTLVTKPFRPKPVLDLEPLYVNEYRREIMALLWEDANKMMARPDYMSYQRDLEWDMRQKLLGWLFQVHAQFRLQPETLFITANVLDRFLSLKAVNVSRLQLAGVTSLLIASKFEEIKCPTVRDLVYMVDNAYKPHEITEAERYILTSVHFKLAYPHPLQFVDHIAKQIGLDLTSKYLAQYFSHLSLLDPVFLQYPSHLVGAASVFLATKVVHNIQWTTEHIKQSGYTEQQLLNCVFKLLENCKKATESVEHLVIYKMFASDRYENVSVSMHQFLKRQSY